MCILNVIILYCDDSLLIPLCLILSCVMTSVKANRQLLFISFQHCNSSNFRILIIVNINEKVFVKVQCFPYFHDKNKIASRE